MPDARLLTRIRCAFTAPLTRLLACIKQSALTMALRVERVWVTACTDCVQEQQRAAAVCANSCASRCPGSTGFASNDTRPACCDGVTMLTLVDAICAATSCVWLAANVFNTRLYTGVRRSSNLCGAKCHDSISKPACPAQYMLPTVCTQCAHSVCADF